MFLKTLGPDGTRTTVPTAQGLLWFREKQGREQGTPKNSKQTLHKVRIWDLWHHLADFGAIFDPIGFRRGSPNRQFLKKIKNKREKGGPRNGYEKTWFLDRFFIEFRMDFGLIFDVFSYLYHSHMQPSKSSKTIVFPMNFNDFTVQRNMICDDFPDLFRYQF